MIEVGWFKGIVISTNETVIRFDSHTKKNVNPNFISHAHSDHTTGFESKTVKYSTVETKDIITLGKGKTVNNLNILNYGKKIKVNDIEIAAYNAGHMLGSAQFKIDTPEATILYTGDINCIDTLTTKAAECVSCDLLIIETTFGNPNYIFPDREETYINIIKWIVEQISDKKTPIFHAYPAGKAQEIIRLINVFTKIPVVTHPIITKISDVHKKSGVSLDYTCINTKDGKRIVENQQGVYIVPPKWVTNMKIKKASATATGWIVKQRLRGADATFPLSGHADFRQLMNYVEEVSPKRVYTVHGFKKEFAEHVTRKTGIYAQPIANIIQRRIKEYV